MPNAVLFAEIPDEVIAVIVIAAAVLVLVAVIAARAAALARVVNRHLGADWRGGTVLTRPVPNWERVNLFLALEALREQDPAAPPVLSFGY